ncbi:MAG TPA: hypothetical protein VFK80_00600, partial [Limnochordia bacterium]|nr:hypothetical protein [Limnochordia bacterium]
MLTGTLLTWSLGGSAFAADAAADAQTPAAQGANADVGVAVVKSSASIQGDAVYAGQSELSDLIDKMRAQRAATGVASIADIRHLLYFEVQAQWQEKGYTTPPGVDIKLDADNVAALVAKDGSGQPAPHVVNSVAEACPKETYDPAVTGPPQKLIAMNETNTVGWNVKVPQAGLYQVNVKFFPCQGKRATIEAAFAVNGEFQYEEAQRLVFRRSWRDASLPTQDNRGNDIPPLQELVPAWISEPLEDQGAWYVKPLLFYFDKGVNRVGFSLTREPVALAQVEVKSAETLPSYADVKASYQKAGYKPAEGAFIKVQAEDTYLHSDPTLRAQYGRDPNLEPPAGALQRLNLFGDFPWRDPHQWGEWKINVPKDGLYKIGFSVWQGFRNDEPSYRQVYIDGKMPFEELRAFPFYPSKQWKVVTLGTDKEPYLFYLTKGEHTIKLRNTEGPVGKILTVIQDSTRKLSTIVQQIKVITGD